MAASLVSPLDQLIRRGLAALDGCNIAGALQRGATPSEKVEELAGTLLVSMGLGEIADDLDLKAVALLSAASVVGLQLIEQVEPGIHRLESALYALEDLLRRTAPVRA